MKTDNLVARHEGIVLQILINPKKKWETKAQFPD